MGKEGRASKRHDALFSLMLLFIVPITVILTIVNFAFIFLGVFAFVVLYFWWDESRKLPYKLKCPNCGRVTNGTVMTYVLHLHDFVKVYMRCPICGKYGWLEAVNV
jgi:hypothetical protein